MEIITVAYITHRSRDPVIQLRSNRGLRSVSRIKYFRFLGHSLIPIRNLI